MSGFSKDRSDGSIGDNSGVNGPEAMDVEENCDAGGSKGLREPFFLKKIFLEKCGDTSALTTLALSVHAIMLESGFVLLDSCPDRFNFSEELPSVSLKYTLDLIKNSRKETKIDYVTLTFRNLAGVVLVNGNLDGYSGRVYMTYLVKRRLLPLIDLVMDTLKFEKQVSSSSYRDVFMLWRMVKNDVVIPLLIDLCDKAGLESPSCLMRLPIELKQKILQLLPGVSIGYMACVCKEMQNLASNNDLWKQKCMENSLDRYKRLTGEVNWKNVYAQSWRNKHRRLYRKKKRLLEKRSPVSKIRSPVSQIRHFLEARLPRFGGDRFNGCVLGQPSRAWGQRFADRRNVRGRHWQAL